MSLKCLYNTPLLSYLVTFGTIPVVRLMLRCYVRIQILSVYKEFTTWTLIVLHSTRFLSKCNRLGLGLSLTTLFSFFINFNFWWWNTNGKTLDFSGLGCLLVGILETGTEPADSTEGSLGRVRFAQPVEVLQDLTNSEQLLIIF